MFMQNTIDSILKDFEIKIDKLHTIAHKHDEAAEFHNVAIEVATGLRDAAKAEAKRARDVAQRFRKLIA